MGAGALVDGLRPVGSAFLATICNLVDDGRPETDTRGAAATLPSLTCPDTLTEACLASVPVNASMVIRNTVNTRFRSADEPRELAFKRREEGACKNAEKENLFWVFYLQKNASRR
jgi:hypothetical protein